MIIFFDIDNTLIKDNLYPNNYKTIKEIIKLLNQNITIGICTNRPLDQNVIKIMNDYNIDGPIIAESGACYYKNRHLKINNDVKLKQTIKSTINDYLNENNKIFPIKVTNQVNDQNKSIIINNNRKKTCSIRLPKSLQEEQKQIITFMKKNQNLKEFIIKPDKYNNLKINVQPKVINKITTIEKYYSSQQVILVTDYENNIFPIINKNIIIYSVGTNKYFNKKCNEVFSEFGSGVEEILKKILYESSKKEN